MNWRAKLLISYRVIVNRLSDTTTDTDFKVCCELGALSSQHDNTC
jgi:hypothetical protein